MLQPVYLHGSLGREAATGRGVVVATSELMKHMDNGRIEGKNIVIQVLRGRLFIYEFSRINSLLFSISSSQLSFVCRSQLGRKIGALYAP